MLEQEICYDYVSAKNKYDYIDSKEKLEILIKIFGVNNLNVDGKHLIFKFIENTKDEIVKCFIDNNIDPSIKYNNSSLLTILIKSEYIEYAINKNIIRAELSYNSYSPFIFRCIRQRKLESVEMLLKQDFNINILDNDRDILYELMFHNCQENSSQLLIKLIKIIIDKKININHIQENKNTALSYAINNCEKEIVELLLISGANIEIKNVYASFKNIENLKLLLKYGANTNIISYHDEKTPLDKALRKYKEIIHILSECGAKTYDELTTVEYSNLKDNNNEDWNNLYKLLSEGAKIKINNNLISKEEREENIDKYISDLIKARLKI
jgi:ankyrin repeat protein